LCRLSAFISGLKFKNSIIKSQKIHLQVSIKTNESSHLVTATGNSLDLGAQHEYCCLKFGNLGGLGVQKLQNFCNFKAIKWFKIDPKYKENVKITNVNPYYSKILKTYFSTGGPKPPVESFTVTAQWQTVSIHWGLRGHF